MSLLRILEGTGGNVLSSNIKILLLQPLTQRARDEKYRLDHLLIQRLRNQLFFQYRLLGIRTTYGDLLVGTFLCSTKFPYGSDPKKRSTNSAI